jgi:hypothetical protein
MSGFMLLRHCLLTPILDMLEKWMRPFIVDTIQELLELVNVSIFKCAKVFMRIVARSLKLYKFKMTVFVLYQNLYDLSQAYLLTMVILLVKSLDSRCLREQWGCVEVLSLDFLE